MNRAILIVMANGTKRALPCTVAGPVPTGRFELVFTTTMSGYVESCTDPSYCGQALTFSFPVIGAHGVPPTMQSPAVQPALVIAASPTQEFVSWIVKLGGCVVVCSDTRAIVSLACIGAHAWIDGHDGPTVEPKATCADGMHAHVPECILVDFGCKLTIASELERRSVGFTVTGPDRVGDAIARGASGVLLSNGPGDPNNDRNGTRAAAIAIGSGLPTLGICYGHQLLAIADGQTVKRLRCGHRGTNHPIVNTMTGEVSVTSHNHGFTVSEPIANTIVTHRSILDGTVEGIHRGNFRGVQFHPEGAPGPRMDEVMDSFVTALKGAQKCT